jgi:hypothetical protein
VRDQRVRLLSDAEAGLLVVPVSDEQKAAAVQQGESRALQFMMSFSMQDWAAMKLLVAADSCIMPDRRAAHAAGGSAGVRSRGVGDESTQEQRQGKRARLG